MSTITRMKAPARREQLLDAAKAVVAEEGFHGVSIEAVARRAGITRPIVYRHFDDLHELLEALVERETVRALSSLADEAARLLLADPERYPAERSLDHARWLLFSAARQTGLGMP